MDQYQQFIHKSRYARWLESEGRRETWAETVQRYIDFFVEREQLVRRFCGDTRNIQRYLQPRSYAINAVHDDGWGSLKARQRSRI